MNIRFAGGLSGGPILNTEGYCCGIVATGGKGRLARFANGALLWPSLVTRLDPDAEPIIELCKNGVIGMRNLELLFGKRIKFAPLPADVFGDRRPVARLVDLWGRYPFKNTRH